jgi:hypothetical protein
MRKADTAYSIFEWLGLTFLLYIGVCLCAYVNGVAGAIALVAAIGYLVYEIQKAVRNRG